ncbi:MAG: PAS domain-containing protein, partial [Candidatus Roizmanbacteria bacterium]|nr:PAS domain-containing protein [Candidatus Roizmanbacteria bacterium]
MNNLSSIQQTLDRLRPIFAKAAVGDFSEDLPLPETNDELTELYVGIQIMLEVIRSKISSLEYEINQHKRTQLVLGSRTLALQREKARVDALFSSIGEGIVAIDRDQKITFINKTAADLLSWRRDEVLGKDYAEVIHLVDESGNPINAEDRPYASVLRNRKIFHNDEYYCVQKNGRTFAISITAAPLIIDGELVGIID